MDEQQPIVKHINNLIERKKPQLRSRLLHGLVFLLISTTLWLLMKLGHEYTTSITYPVVLTSPPEGFMLVEGKPKYVQMRVKAPGFTLLRYKMGTKTSPISLGVNQYQTSGHNAQMGYYMTLRGQLQNFRAQISSDLELVGISTDTLRFHMAKVVAKRLPVRLRLNIASGGQVMQSGPIMLSPDSVSITGPAALLDTITNVQAVPLTIDNTAAQTLTHTLRLIVPPQTTLSTSTVEANIPVDRFTEMAISLPITPTNVPDSLLLTLIPEKVELTCNVPMGRYFSTNASHFIIECNFDERSQISSGKIRLKLANQPNYVAKINFEPKFVDYFITTKP